GPSALRTARLRVLVRYAALGCRPDEPHVLREHTARGLGRRRSPRLPSSRQFVIADIDGQLTRRGVDGDAIAVAHERDRTSLLRFWRDVPDDEPMRPAREAPVGEQGNARSKAPP